MTKYWTIQLLEKWNKAKELGYLEGEKEYVWDSFNRPYKWMMKQMKKRLSNYNGEYPIWLWTKRPDLRGSGYLTKGTKGVLLEIELDSQDVLLSDFESWHCILNNSFVSLNEEEDELFDDGKLDITKEESWERIFDFELLGQCDKRWLTDLSTIQGVTGRIVMENIKLIREFTSR